MSTINDKIVLEEHFALEETLQGSFQGSAAIWAELKARLLDFDDMRLREMDAHGIGLMAISLNAPAVQAVRNTHAAIDLARRANDFLAAQILRRPDRYCGFATLPLQDPDEAVLELERAVTSLGFKGVLINGFSQRGATDEVLYYDRAEYRPFWKALCTLDVPLYLHARNPLPRMVENFGSDTWLLGPTWAFAAETAVHALRLVGSGLFDELPTLKIILGHLGEGIPPMLWRMDNYSRWMNHGAKHHTTKPLRDYFRSNFFITTSGNLYEPTFDIVLREFGAKRVMFSIDYPFEDIQQSAEWFECLTLSDQERRMVGRDNAAALLKID